jgi:hypothetical protein
VAGWFSQYYLSLPCFVFVTVLLFEDLLRLYDTFHVILVGMGMHWLECVIGIVGKVEWNTFVLSVTISHWAYFGTASPKYAAFCVFNQIFL